MKTCNGPCGQLKEDSSFGRRTFAGGRVGLRSMCYICNNASRDAWRLSNKEKDNQRNKEYNKRNAQRLRGMKLKKYWPEATWEQALINHETLLIKQNHGCAICGKSGHATKGLHVDHCHKTNKVRGLLCYNCNSLLGRAKDSIDILKSSIVYLEQSERKAS